MKFETAQTQFADVTFSPPSLAWLPGPGISPGHFVSTNIEPKEPPCCLIHDKCVNLGKLWYMFHLCTLTAYYL